MSDEIKDQPIVEDTNPATQDVFSFLEESSVPKVPLHPWMTDGSHQFVLGTADNLTSIIDLCIASGLYSLDLETTGLDNRVFDGETVDKIVGCCLSADGVTGYYIPLRHKKGIEHNVPWSLFKRELLRLIASPAITIFHLGKFDQEFLQFCGGEPLGEWDDPKKWEDTLILAYLRDTRQKRIGLKFLAENDLGMTMIELEELFTDDQRKSGRLDFSELDPSWRPVTLYGASDAICTWKLYPKLSKTIHQPEDGNGNQTLIYMIEKLCVTSTRWMERARILMDQEKARELIRIGQREWIDSIEEVYKSASEIVGRDVRPGFYRLMIGLTEGASQKFDVDEVSPSYMDRVDSYRQDAIRLRLDPTETKGKKAVVQTVTKRMPSLVVKGATDDVAFPLVYDLLSPPQLGQLLRECKVPGLTVTEKSGQISTAADELDRVLEEQGNKFPFAGKIKRFREIGKALSTYLFPIIEDCAPDGSLRADFNAHKLDTGRFSAPASKNPKLDGGTRFPFHGTPATYDPNRPECMGRIRECVIARPGKIIAACDFSGVELRIVTNLSKEPKWLREFFHCSGCDHMFDAGDGESTPEAPPPFCPVCGSDKIGDLHTLTALSLYGNDAISRPDWKVLRGNSKCIHPDTLVFLKGRPERIGSLVVGEPETFRGTDTRVWTGSKHVPVRETYNGGVKPLFHVVTRRGIITCTDQHGIVLADGSLRTIADGLVRGDRLAEPSVPPPWTGSTGLIQWRPYPNLPEAQVQASHGLAYFAGLVSGDGAKSGTTSIGICHGHIGKVDQLGVPYQTWQDLIVVACQNVGFDPVRRKGEVTLGSRHTMRFLTALGLVNGVEGGRTLRVPPWVIQAGPDGVLHFLGGLFDTDGSVNKKDHTIECTSKDAVFIGQIAALLHAIGIKPSVEPCWNKTYKKWYFRVRIMRVDATRFAPYMKHPGKTLRLVGGTAGTRLPNLVIEIIQAGNGPCVDLHLGNTDHLYWANGLLTHNSTNFALCYGGGGGAVDAATGCGKQEGWRIKDQFDKSYRGLAGWWKHQHAYARKFKYVVTAFNRRYPLPDIDHELSGIRSKAERNATNGPIQGSSADITKLAMGLIYKECKKRDWLEKVHMLITMHDELVFEIDKDILAEAVGTFTPIMNRNPALLKLKWPVPLTSDVELGLNWMVPWNLVKMQKKGNWPEELRGLFPESDTVPTSSEDVTLKPKSQKKSDAVRTYKIKSFSVSEIEGLAQLLIGTPVSPASLQVLGPNDEDLTPLLMTAWGGLLPEVEA
jgi:DNA polymerase I-like protein with 3'-5' exonuclease and polymerase domains